MRQPHVGHARKIARFQICTTPMHDQSPAKPIVRSTLRVTADSHTSGDSCMLTSQRLLAQISAQDIIFGSQQDMPSDQSELH